MRSLGTDHVISGPMRGLAKKLRQMAMRGLKKKKRHLMAETDRQTEGHGNSMKPYYI